jgi:hypothetical protein
MAAGTCGRKLFLQANSLMYANADDLASVGAPPNSNGGEQGRGGNLVLGRKGNASGRGRDLLQQEASNEVRTECTRFVFIRALLLCG